MLEESDRFQTAQDIHERLRSGGTSVGLATVYRTLQTLVQENRIDVLRTPDGEATYRLCATDKHHHHLVCTACGTSVEVADPSLERWANNSAVRHGFTHESHIAEIYGVCPACSGS